MTDAPGPTGIGVGGWVRRGLLAAAAVLVAIAVGTWALPGRSARGAFVLSPGGTVIAGGACVGEVVIYAARYRLGPGQPWAAQTFAGELEADYPLELYLSRLQTPPLSGRWGFYAAATRWSSFAGRPPVSVGEHSAAAVLAVPAWALLPIGILLATPAARQVIRNCARRRAGRCVGCGYDLRHSPTRCPECGRPSSIAGGGSSG